MSWLSPVDDTLAELANQRELAILQFREALDGVIPMPNPDPFDINKAINRKLDQRIAIYGTSKS